MYWNGESKWKSCGLALPYRRALFNRVYQVTEVHKPFKLFIVSASSTAGAARASGEGSQGALLYAALEKEHADAMKKHELYLKK